MKKSRRDDDGSAPDAARLLRDLAARERQLRDLTEQSLGFLEELAESRRLNAEREQLTARLAELERTLGDARQRLRHAGGTAPNAPAKGGKKRPAIEIVFWGAAGREAAVAAAASTKLPVTWVGLPDAVPASAAAKDVTIVTNREARTPAQCWNLGMAATTADLVLMVGPDMRLDAVPELPADVPANTVFLCPRIDRDGVAEVGLEQADPLLRLRARPIATGESATVLVPWPCADAFCVRRAAFERIGTFDEALLGPAALLEYTFRARRANFDVLGVPAVAVTGAVREGAAGEDDATARERLVLLAMHRPELLAPALAESPVLWQMGAGEAPGFVAQLLGRLPTADGLGDQRAMLERIVLGLVQHSLPTSRAVAMIQSARAALLRGFVDAGTVAGREEFLAALRRAEAPGATDPATELDALLHDIGHCRGAAAGTARVLEQTRTEMRALDAQRHSQSDRAERAEGARQQTQTQLDQVQVWLREAQQESRTAQEGRLQESRAAAEQRAQLQLKVAEQQRDAARAAELDAKVGELQRGNEQLGRQLEEARAELVLSRAKYEAAMQQHRELEREFLGTDTDLRALREQVGQMARLLGVVGGASPENLQERLHVVHEQAQQLALALHATGASDAEALLQRLDDLGQRLAGTEHVLRERERWIALLLHEVGQRRLFPRPLLPHEQEFVDRAAASRTGQAP
jgi:hypothetical protein